MCGIVACQTRPPALDFLIPALRRVEYRGYDSVGVAVRTTGGNVVRLRSVGRLDSLQSSVDGYVGATLDGVGIGHTRWATHGVVSEENSHPHTDCLGDVHVVHNGIIENAEDLRADLSLRGHAFATEVDSETVAHLVEEALADGAGLPEAVEKASARLVGSWALAVIRRGEDAVVVTANRSPLVVATGGEGAYAASDLTALAGWTTHAQVVADGDVVVLEDDRLSWRRADGSSTAPALLSTSLAAVDVELGAASDFMGKEISEQSAAVEGIVNRLADGICDGRLWHQLGLPPLSRVRFVACGTSLNGAAVLNQLLAAHGIAGSLSPASESEGAVLESGTLLVALSQSGETADVLRALEVSSDDRVVLALTNVGSSTLGRTADASVELGVGPEIGVAATKTFTAQVVAGAAVMISGLVYARRISPVTAGHLTDRLRALPQLLAEADELARNHVADVVASATDATGFLFVGRGTAVPYASEGALKLKEITYRWAECQPAGELKHGPIALIDRGTPVVVIDDGHPKLAANISEMRARHAHVITIGGPESSMPYRLGSPDGAPWGPLASVVVLQHLARELAVALGRDVDKPRNLAKSVTVE
jgi:glucosamine--fructose-6-phosphate aminotransferase (isomerizing)